MKTLMIGSAVALAFLAASPSFAQRSGAPREGRRASPAAVAPTAPAAPVTPDTRENNQRPAAPEGQAPTLAVGGTVPYNYMVGGKYIDYKWRESGLSSPPEGYAWMRIGEDYVLADQKSGAIKEVLKVSEQNVALTEGGTVPYSYMVGGKYIDYKWRESGLASPPPGYAWMRIGNKFVLADQKSGLIKDVRGVDEARPGSAKIGDRRR